MKLPFSILHSEAEAGFEPRPCLPLLAPPDRKAAFQMLQKGLLDSEFTRTFVPGTQGETSSCPDKAWMELGESSVPRPASVRQQTQAKLQSGTTVPWVQ